MLLDRLSPRPLVAACFLAGLAFQLLLGASYVGAFVDPVETSTGLPVAVVNLDEGGRGIDLVDRLRSADSPVRWVEVDTRERAIHGMETNRYAGALVLPANLTEALGSFMTPAPHAATVEVLLNVGGSRTGSLVAEGVLEVGLDRLRAEVQGRALDAAEVQGGLGAVTLEQARFLANPVRVDQAMVNPIPPMSGNGMAPVYLAMSAWVGGYFGAVAVEKFQPQHRLRPRFRVLLLPMVGLAQGVVTLVALRLVGFEAGDAVLLAALLGLATWMAYAVVGFLLDLFGLAGVLPAFAILTLGLPASGGIYPAEMLPDLWRALHDASPFTWIVGALRTALYTPGAGDLTANALRIGILAIVATAATVAWEAFRESKRTA